MYSNKEKFSRDDPLSILRVENDEIEAACVRYENQVDDIVR